MNFVAIDLKTTGLVAGEHQILEVGAVIGSWDGEVRAMPAWTGLVCEQRIVGHPTTLTMNAEVIDLINSPSRWTDFANLNTFSDTCQLWQGFANWLDSQIGRVSGRVSITLAARDERTRAFLMTDSDFRALFTICGETMTPGGLYYRRGEIRLPRLEECLARAGVVTTYGDMRRAVRGAYNVVQLLRNFYDVRE